MYEGVHIKSCAATSHIAVLQALTSGCTGSGCTGVPNCTKNTVTAQWGPDRVGTCQAQLTVQHTVHQRDGKNSATGLAGTRSCISPRLLPGESRDLQWQGRPSNSAGTITGSRPVCKCSKGAVPAAAVPGGPSHMLNTQRHNRRMLALECCSAAVFPYQPSSRTNTTGGATHTLCRTHD